MHDGNDHIHEHHNHFDLSKTDDEQLQIKTLTALLPHWIEHNDSHMETYGEWAMKISQLGKTETADAIREAIGLIETANLKLKQAESMLDEE